MTKTTENNTKEDNDTTENSTDKVFTKDQRKKIKKKIGKPKCGVEGCKGRVVQIIGTCKWCSKTHCQEHRLPESHMCHRIQSCRDSAAEMNRRNLENCKSVAAKVVRV